jgi:signal transduction histidine kinase
LLLPTLLIAGLVIGGYFLGAWTAVCALLLVWLAATTSGIAWTPILFWCGLYVTIAYLVWIFSFHLESLLAASRRAGDEQRDAVLEERTRLAREVHDTLAQGFTGIVVQINAAEQAATAPEPDVWGHLEKARALARQSLEEARRSILTLRTSGPEEFDLLARIEQTARQLLADESVEFSAVREGTTCELPDETGSELLRVGQEAVANAIRHSGATKIHVSFACLPHRVSLSITDNGRGIPADVRGLGIQGMEERMRRSGGELKIERAPTAGTKVTATVPLKNGSAS